MTSGNARVDRCVRTVRNKIVSNPSDGCGRRLQHRYSFVRSIRLLSQLGDQGILSAAGRITVSDRGGIKLVETLLTTLSLVMWPVFAVGNRRRPFPAAYY